MNSYILRWLNDRGIRDKLLIFIAIPIISILFFSFFGISDKYQQYVNSKNTQSFLSIVVKLDDLVHELQKERGISTGLVEANSTFFQNDIPSQRELTDKALHSFFQHKGNVDTNFLSRTIREQSTNLDILLEQLPTIRASIDAKDFDNVVHNYSDLNAHAISYMQYLQSLTNDSELTRLSGAYTNLLWLQERAGQERAALIWVFASGHMDADYFRQVVSYIESQEILLKSYNLKTTDEYRHLLHQKLSHPVNREVAEFRNAVNNKIIRNQLLNELQELIGYGGLIHEFKNYIVRGDKAYLKNFQQKKSDVRDLIERYEALPGITQEDLLHLNAISETLDNYFRLIGEIPKYLQQNLSVQEIDKLVRVDDGPALQAITYLRKGFTTMDAYIWWKNSTERLNLIKEVNDQLKSDILEIAAKNTQSAIFLLWVYVLLTIFTFLVSFVLGEFLMRRLIGELKNISNNMREMFKEKVFDRPLNIQGRDEIGVMAGTFNQLISERLKLESELRLSSEVFANAKEAIMIADADKKIQMINPAFQAVSGYGEADVLEKDFFCLSEYSMDETPTCLVWSKLQQKLYWEGELWNKKPDGEKYLVRLNISVVRDKNGVISQYIGMFTDITQRKQYEEHIWRQANYDALTDLPNRNMCMNQLAHNLKVSNRKDMQIAVLFIDLDRFKLINDTLGHSAGDELLKEIAARLRDTIRESDIVSRLGGDEFIIILNDVSEISVVERISRNILAAISMPVLLNDKSETFTSGSIGIALFPHDGVDVETLMKHADTAMYQSKKMGRNNFMFYKQEMNKAVMQHMKIEKELRQAIINREFSLYYQPVIDLPTGRILGAEALIRWHHPIQGLVGPDSFIRIAEDSELIVPIGEWVVATAAHQASEWNKASKQLLKIAINISSRQFVDNGRAIISVLEKAFKEARLKPGMLEIEITESLLMNGAPETIDSLQQIRDIGIGISLDDFGTGYSSLSYLKHFPISTIKIDRSFIQDVTTNKKDAQLVQAIVMLSKGLELDVICEGIEKVEHLAFLKNLNCKAGQGYFFARPMAINDFENYLLNHDAISLPAAMDGSNGDCRFNPDTPLGTC